MNLSRFTAPLLVQQALAGMSLIAVAGLVAPVAFGGVIYRCETAAGVIEYSNAQPAKKDKRTCREIELPAITTIPAPTIKVPASASKKKAPQVIANTGTNSAQQTRDNDRAQILRDELRREQEILASLKEEYKDGEPDRRGDERNYQKYLDRVASLKENIARGEANVQALQRELAVDK